MQAVDPDIEALAEAIWSIDAPRYANDVFPLSEVRDARRPLCLQRAEAAMRCLLELGYQRPVVPA